MACFPRVRLNLGRERCIIEGKNPNMLEKPWGVKREIILICLEAVVANVRAMIRPRIVTIKAAILRGRGIVITGALCGKKFKVIIRPAMILPQARRSIGIIIIGLFSLMGDKVEKRGDPIVTKKITRRL